ncbi:MAG: GNAT family N-acetyltransferase [Desulfohalobiaceae bacterium]|nr:GNAT family N-acetyltransferase [Desulfohalobiaceae bacterium]
MPINLRRAKNTAEKDLVYTLRHKVFVEEELRFLNHSSRIYDFYDSFDETVNILAFDGDRPVGSIRVTLDNPVGLPASEFYDFSGYISRLRGKCASIGWLCVLHRYRRHPGLLMGLLKMVVREMRRTDCRHIITTVHPPIFEMLKHGFGARAVDNVFESGELKVPMLPVHIDTHKAPPGALEPFRDPPNPVLEESMERRIYHRKEVIFKHGETAREAFYIMRGSVRNLPLGHKAISWKMKQGPLAPDDELLSRGEIFGVLPLLDNGPRVHTMIPYSHEVDVMVWSIENIENQLLESPKKTMKVVQSFSRRLRQKIEGNVRRPNAAEVANVLFDASEEGKKSVRKDWLGRQCGIWPHNLEEIIASWTHSDIIHPQNGFINVTDAHRLHALGTLTRETGLHPLH